MLWQDKIEAIPLIKSFVKIEYLLEVFQRKYVYEFKERNVSPKKNRKLKKRSRVLLCFSLHEFIYNQFMARKTLEFTTSPRISPNLESQQGMHASLGTVVGTGQL